MENKNPQESFQEYIDKRYRRGSYRGDVGKKRKKRNSIVIVVNAVLIVFMIYLYRTDRESPRYFTKTVQTESAGYRFSILTAPEGGITAGLSIRNTTKSNIPLMLKKGGIELTILHKTEEILNLPVDPADGPVVIAPGKSKSITKAIDRDSILPILGIDEEPEGPMKHLYRIMKTEKTVPFTARLVIKNVEPAVITIDMKCEVAQ